MRGRIKSECAESVKDGFFLMLKVPALESGLLGLENNYGNDAVVC